MRQLILCSLILFCFAGCKKETKSDFQANSGSYDHEKQVGASANDLLASKNYSSLTIEILYMPGYALQSGAITQLNNFLSIRVNKPGGINIQAREIPASASAVLSLSEVKALENANRKSFADQKNMALTIVITNGTYTDNKVLGVAYRNTSAALFGKLIAENSGGIGKPSRDKLEASVLEHEIGHLLGLVDIGSPMVNNHKDAANGNHCNNKDCLMYYASETTSIITALAGGTIPALDTNCIDDLRANGGK